MRPVSVKSFTTEVICLSDFILFLFYYIGVMILEIMVRELYLHDYDEENKRIYYPSWVLFWYSPISLI